MSNITLVYPNRIDECLIADTVPSNWSTQLPITNIQSPVIKKVARTNIGVVSTEITLNNVNQSRPIGGIAIINHNMTTSAKVRFEGWSGLNLTGTKRFDSTPSYRSYPIMFPIEGGAIPFESRGWFAGTIEEAERKSYTSVCSFFLPENAMCQSFKITITDTRSISATSSDSKTIAKGLITFNTVTAGNFISGQEVTIYSSANNTNYMKGIVSSCVGTALLVTITQIGGSGTFASWNIITGDNYLQIGRIILGKAVTPERNPEFGDFSIGYIDLSEMQRANDNTKYFYIKPRMRVVSANFKHLNKLEAYHDFLDAQRSLGISGELLFTFSKPEYFTDGVTNSNITKDINHYANTFLCNFPELNPLEMPYVNGYSAAIKLEEIV